jgi:transcriptional regulator with XRE-family HTH domain
MTTLRKLRKDNGLTQAELAELVGLSRKSVNEYEKSSEIIDRMQYKYLKEYADLFGLTVIELITRIEKEVEHDTVSKSN